MTNVDSILEEINIMDRTQLGLRLITASAGVCVCVSLFRSPIFNHCAMALSDVLWMVLRCARGIWERVIY